MEAGTDFQHRGHMSVKIDGSFGGGGDAAHDLQKSTLAGTVFSEDP